MLAFVRCLSGDSDSQTSFILPPEGLGSRLASAGPFFRGYSIRRGSPVMIQAVPSNRSRMPCRPTGEGFLILLVTWKGSFLKTTRISARWLFNRDRSLWCGLLFFAVFSNHAGCRTETTTRSDHPAVIREIPASVVEQSPPTSIEPRLVAEPRPDAQTSSLVPNADPHSVSPPLENIVKLDGGVTAWVGQGRVEFPGMVSLDQGWLEVAVCRRGSREHESIVVTDAIPSVVHAAMLLAGLEPGTPATFDEKSRLPIPPTGTVVSIELRFSASDLAVDVPIVLPLAEAIEDAREQVSPVWVFAGSLVRPNPSSMGPGEYYAADYAGTVVGLSTFGDEVVAVEEVRSPESGVDPPVWRIRAGVLPEVDTAVTVVLKRSPREE